MDEGRITPDPDEADQQVVLEELYDENYEPTEAGWKRTGAGHLHRVRCEAASTPITTQLLSVCRDTGVCQMAGNGHRE